MAPMLLTTLLALSPPVDAKRLGIDGYSQSGCICHGRVESLVTEVTMSSPRVFLTSNQIAPIKVTVAHPDLTAGGLNVSADGGSFSAGSNTQLMAGEITHTQPEALSGGSVDFKFIWKAPAAPGLYTLSAAGNAVNEDGDRSDADDWALADDLQIVVMPPGPAGPPAFAWAGLLLIWGWRRGSLD